AARAQGRRPGRDRGDVRGRARDGKPARCEGVRAARRHMLRPLALSERPRRRGSRSSRTAVRLVHRGLRHTRPRRGEGAARGAGVEANEPTVGIVAALTLEPLPRVPETPPDRPPKILERARLLRSPVGVPQTEEYGTPRRAGVVAAIVPAPVCVRRQAARHRTAGDRPRSRTTAPSYPPSSGGLAATPDRRRASPAERGPYRGSTPGSCRLASRSCDRSSDTSP